MAKNPNDVVITGLGIVSCHGVGKNVHEAILSANEAPQPIVDRERFEPYPVHPLPDIDWTEQIPRRGDQRQMENWQRLGVFTAGLALDDAGLKDDAELCGSMDMIVAAGGGERDIAVDTMIVNKAMTRNDRDNVLNEILTTELRPTLFLAQLSNLLAGNISIVHKVTGSSKTFMGEEAAGISALATALERIRAGQTTHALVGGAYNAERQDMLVLYEGVQSLAQGGWQPLWSRADNGGGVITGSASAFLMLESREHAQSRGANIYASITDVDGDRGNRDEGGLEKRLNRLADHVTPGDVEHPLVMSGASGHFDLRDRERKFIEDRWPGATLRGFGGITGHAMEAQFPIGVALAALALQSGAKLPRFDEASEAEMSEPADTAIVTAVGFMHGEGLALLKSE
ncbi:beta-ketoacyl-ACP synthase [Hoeflea sp.]|uniref:beta-ketoacyl-ACP synthase n=1 Tax=Hoeflea sp. TaxID=1940281 RepID=UPI003B02E05C